MDTELTSPVWGTVSYPVSADHYQLNTWTSCSDYDYIGSYCMDWSPTTCYHPGMDIAMPRGTTLYAPAAGEVTCAGSNNGSGYDGSGCVAFEDNSGGVGRVELLLDDGSVAIFGHSSGVLVGLGDQVVAGTPVARSGTAGAPIPEGDHLHFEHRVPDASCTAGYAIVDPKPLLTGDIEPPPPSGDYGKADIVKTDDALNLRDGPGLGATVIGSVPLNAILVLEGPSEYRDGYWWFQHRSHWGYGWSIDLFTEYGQVQNFSRNPGGDSALTGIRAIGGATVSFTSSGHVRVDCPAGSANAGVQYTSFPNLNVGDGRSVIALWDLLGLFGNDYDFIARYTDGTTQRVGGPFAGSAPDGATWARNFSTVLTLDGAKVCDELLFRLRNQDATARVFHIDNVDFISL